MRLSVLWADRYGYRKAPAPVHQKHLSHGSDCRFYRMRSLSHFHCQHLFHSWMDFFDQLVIPAQGLVDCALFSLNSFQLFRSGQYLLFNVQPTAGLWSAGS